MSTGLCQIVGLAMQLEGWLVGSCLGASCLGPLLSTKNLCAATTPVQAIPHSLTHALPCLSWD